MNVIDALEFRDVRKKNVKVEHSNSAYFCLMRNNWKQIREDFCTNSEELKFISGVHGDLPLGGLSAAIFSLFTIC